MLTENNTYVVRKSTLDYDCFNNVMILNFKSVKRNLLLLLIRKFCCFARNSRDSYFYLIYHYLNSVLLR